MTRTTTHFEKASKIHISEGEALRDFATVFARVSSGRRIVIDSELHDQGILADGGRL